MYAFERGKLDENLNQGETLINDNTDDYFILNDQQKFVILIIAVILFFLTLILTICFVSPSCLLRKLLNKFSSNDEVKLKSKTIIKPSLSPDSKSFQLTVVPEYVEKRKLELELNKKNEKLNFLYKNNPINEKNDFWLNISPKKRNLRELFKNKQIKCNSFFTNDKNYIEKTYEKWNNRLNKTKSLDTADKNLDYENNFIKTFSQIEVVLCLKSESISKNNVRLNINLKQVNNLPLKINGLEPSFYVIIKILNNNSTINKASFKKQKKSKIIKFQSEIFKTKTSSLLNLSYFTEELMKSYLKESKLIIKVMAVDKHINDYCLGETLISLKQFLNEEKIASKEIKETFKTFKLEKSREIKGELLLSVCFLPTSKRATFKVIKANLNKQLKLLDFTQNYFIRILMICNGKIIKKKKTSSNDKLDWQFNEIINFDLSNLIDEKIEQLCFLIVLSSYKENESSSLPTSPDTPNDNLEKNNLSLKPVKNAIAHFVLNKEYWNQICREPRKKIEQWVKLI